MTWEARDTGFFWDFRFCVSVGFSADISIDVSIGIFIDILIDAFIDISVDMLIDISIDILTGKEGGGGGSGLFLKI